MTMNSTLYKAKSVSWASRWTFIAILHTSHVVFLELPGLELGEAPGDEPGGASGDERLALLIVKLKLRGGGGLLAVPLHQRSVVFRCRKHRTRCAANFQVRSVPAVFFQVAGVWVLPPSFMAYEGWVPSF